jgi:hypothetical protein
MTVIEDFQPLIDWCTQPHPQDRPRLQRAAFGVLQLSRPITPADNRTYWGTWTGSLVYWPPRGRHVHGGFSGVLTRQDGGGKVHVWLTLAEDKAWIGIQGPGIGAEWSEDAFANYREVYGKQPETINVYMVFDAGDPEREQFLLTLTPISLTEEYF